MNLYELKQSKAGMTLVEMVISLLILSVLMTSTMGMIISSNNLFISTSKATIDKQVGNGIFDLFSNVLRYTTHLEISNAENSAMNQHISVKDIVYEGDEELESGWLYYQPKGADESSLLYDSSYYGSGASKRTVQYSVTKYVGEDGSSDGKHVNLEVKVIREGKVVYTRSAIIRCVNLALVTGAQGNAVSQTDDAPDYNQTLSFSVDEQIVSGGSSAWTIEYKVNEYLARYNTILQDYYGTLIGTTNNPGPVTALNTYYEDNYNKVTKKAVTQNTVNNCFKAIFGSSSTDDKGIYNCYTNNVSSNGALPTEAGKAPVVDGDAYTGWTNLRAYYQKQIYDLLKFSPATITDNTDPYYMIIADKEELYLGFLLTYYDKNSDGKIEKDEYPTFDDPENFFANTVLEKYATGDSTSAPDDKMVILGLFTDVNNDTFYVNNQDYYANKTQRTLTVTTSGFADHISGVKHFGNKKIAFATEYTYRFLAADKYEYKYVDNIITTADVDTTKAYVDGRTSFSLTNYGRSETTGSVDDVGTYYTTNSSSTVTDASSNVTKVFYYPTAKTTVTRTPTNRNYTKYSISENGKQITLTIQQNQTQNKYTYSHSSIKYYVYDDSNAYYTYDYCYDVGRYGYKYTRNFYTMDSIWDKKGIDWLNLTLGKFTTTNPTEITETFTDGAFTEDQTNDYNSWNTTAQALITKLGAKNAGSSEYFTVVTGGDKTGISTSVSKDGTSTTKPTSNGTLYILTPTKDIYEGWYYFFEGSTDSTGAYHFFYLSANHGDTTGIDLTYTDTDGSTKTYVVNDDDIAISKEMTDGQVILNSSGWDLVYYAYDQTQYELANTVDTALNSPSTQTVTFYTYDLKCHQYVDWVLYSVDWNSWFSKTSTGLINKVISFFQRLFTGDNSISSIAPSNAQQVLGVKGQLTVGSTDLDAYSYNLAWLVYASDYGTWYYLPQSSSMASTYLSGTGWYSNKDGPQLLDIDNWGSSSAINADIQNRKLTKAGLFGITYIAGVDFSASTDVNWTSLPSTAEKVSTD